MNTKEFRDAILVSASEKLGDDAHRVISPEQAAKLKLLEAFRGVGTHKTVGNMLAEARKNLAAEEASSPTPKHKIS